MSGWSMITTLKRSVCGFFTSVGDAGSRVFAFAVLARLVLIKRSSEDNA